MSRTLITLACLACLAGCTPSSMMKTESLPGIPDAAYAKGVSAPFCGILDGALIVAGGANFPEKSLLEGGPKRVYRDIWAYRDGRWSHRGLLPDSTAYGATFTLPGKLLFVGGSVCGNASDQVLELRADGLFPAGTLPVPLEQAGAAQNGAELFLVGGTNGSPVLRCRDGKWEQIARLPEPLVQPVAYAKDDKLFVWGGFNPQTLLAPSEGLCLDLKSLEWGSAPGIPDGGSFVGASGALLPDGRLLVLGGVNKAVFERALRNTAEDRIPYLSQDPSWYRFRQEVYVFDGTAWTLLGVVPETALAGPGVAVADSLVYVSGGELKPGVRSPLTFCFAYHE